MSEENSPPAEPITIVTDLSEIPRFRSEWEAAAYWETHQLSEALWDQLPDPTNTELAAAHSRTRSVAIRFDESTLERLKELASRRNKGYQTLLKEFVVERLYEEEKREGLVG